MVWWLISYITMVLKVWSLDQEHQLLHQLGSVREANYWALPRTCPVRNSGWSPTICAFNKPSRQFLHTLNFENYCSIKAGYFHTTFLIFLYLNVKLTINGQGNVFKGNWEDKQSQNPQDIHTRLKAEILNPSWIMEWLRSFEICQDLIPSQMKQTGGEGGSNNIYF